jgi:hypothetical protein
MMLNSTISPRVKKVLHTARSLSTTERLILAKLLLDSLVVDEAEDAADWLALGLTTFEKDWNNPDDAIYDNWREAYGVSTG